MVKKKRGSYKKGRGKLKGFSRPRGKSGLKEMTGSLKMHREGNYGFVLPEDPALEDVFVPLRRLGDALDMDRVRISYWKDSADGRLEGTVEEVIERGKRFWVGTLVKHGKQYLCECRVGRRRIAFQVDPADLKGARLGDALGIEAVSFPEGGVPGQGRMVQLFGARGDETTETDIIILKHQLPRQFPEPVLTEARRISGHRTMDGGERKDLKNLELVTIDGETARDFDDAICVKKEGGGYRLWVAIADVSFYVLPNSPIDREAFSRGTSVYFTNKVVPMLPEELSNDLCSLRPQEDRLAFTAEMFFDREGRIREKDFYRSVIRSKGRLTYHQVAKACLERQEEARVKIKAHLPMLETAFELFKILRKNRLGRGSLDFDLPEPEIILEIETGDIETIVKAERNEAHMLIEEFMVAANEAVAEFLTRLKGPTLYRVHPPPDADKVEQFQTLLKNLGFSIRFPASPRPKDLARVLNQAKGHPEEKLVNYFTLRTMKQAVYSPKNEGHFGLASPCYTHFTSPIRRYPDLVIHRLLAEALERNEVPRAGREKQAARLGATARHASRRERVAMEAEWEARDLMTALFMKKHLGQFFEGNVARVTKFGFFVELQKYFVEGLVLLEEIRDEHFVFEEKHHRLRGRRSKKVYKIGTEVRVQVSKVDLEERRVYFRLA